MILDDGICLGHRFWPNESSIASSNDSLIFNNRFKSSEPILYEAVVKVTERLSPKGFVLSKSDDTQNTVHKYYTAYSQYYRRFNKNDGFCFNNP